MSKSLNIRLTFFFVGILVITILGFYKTYLIKFPNFEGVSYVYHIHGALAFSWILMLIAQPILIQNKRLDWHRLIGRLSYIIMPLLLLSFFFVAKEGYLRNIRTLGKIEALSALTNGIPDVFYMGIMYLLGIFYKKNTQFHLRFMCATGLMIVGPGLGRFFMFLIGIPLQYAIPLIIIISSGTGLIWMVLDIRNKKSAFPMGVFVFTGIVASFINANAHSEWWLSFADWLVSCFF